MVRKVYGGWEYTREAVLTTAIEIVERAKGSVRILEMENLWLSCMLCVWMFSRGEGS